MKKSHHEAGISTGTLCQVVGTSPLNRIFVLPYATKDGQLIESGTCENSKSDSFVKLFPQSCDLFRRSVKNSVTIFLHGLMSPAGQKMNLRSVENVGWNPKRECFRVRFSDPNKRVDSKEFYVRVKNCILALQGDERISLIDSMLQDIKISSATYRKMAKLKPTSNSVEGYLKLLTTKKLQIHQMIDFNKYQEVMTTIPHSDSLCG